MYLSRTKPNEPVQQGAWRRQRGGSETKEGGERGRFGQIYLSSIWTKVRKTRFHSRERIEAGQTRRQGGGWQRRRAENVSMEKSDARGGERRPGTNLEKKKKNLVVSIAKITGSKCGPPSTSCNKGKRGLSNAG